MCYEKMPYGETLIRTHSDINIFLTTELTEICRRPTDHREVINESFRSFRVFRVRNNLCVSVPLCV